jgi:hypothetical protein
MQKLEITLFQNYRSLNDLHLKNAIFFGLLFKREAHERSSQYIHKLSSIQTNFVSSAAQNSTILSCAYRNSSLKLRA